jgi:cell division protein FtsL
MVPDLKRKKKREFPNSNFFWMLGFFLVLIVSAVLVFVDIKISQKKKEFTLQVQAYQEKIREAEQKNKDLEKGIASIDDENYIEKVAREELGLQKKDEKVISFVMPEQKKNESPQQTQSFFSAKILTDWLYEKWQWLTRKPSQ